LRALPANSAKVKRLPSALILRSQLQQGGVDATQFFGTEVFVVDGAGDFAVASEGEMVDGVQEVGVGEGAGRE
jgi:hypothetical protein